MASDPEMEVAGGHDRGVGASPLPRANSPASAVAEAQSPEGTCICAASALGRLPGCGVARDGVGALNINSAR